MRINEKVLILLIDSCLKRRNRQMRNLHYQIVLSVKMKKKRKGISFFSRILPIYQTKKLCNLNFGPAKYTDKQSS